MAIILEKVNIGDASDEVTRKNYDNSMRLAEAIDKKAGSGGSQKTLYEVDIEKQYLAKQIAGITQGSVNYFLESGLIEGGISGATGELVEQPAGQYWRRTPLLPLEQEGKIWVEGWQVASGFSRTVGLYAGADGSEPAVALTDPSGYYLNQAGKKFFSVFIARINPAPSNTPDYSNTKILVNSTQNIEIAPAAVKELPEAIVRQENLSSALKREIRNAGGISLNTANLYRKEELIAEGINGTTGILVNQPEGYIWRRTPLLEVEDTDKVYVEGWQLMVLPQTIGCYDITGSPLGVASFDEGTGFWDLPAGTQKISVFIIRIPEAQTPDYSIIKILLNSKEEGLRVADRRVTGDSLSDGLPAKYFTEEDGQLLYKGEPVASGTSSFIVDIPVSPDGSGISRGYAYIEQSTGNIKVKL